MSSQRGRGRGASTSFRYTFLSEFERDSSVDVSGLSEAEFERRIRQASVLVRDVDSREELRSRIAAEVVKREPTRPWVIAALNRRLDELDARAALEGGDEA